MLFVFLTLSLYYLFKRLTKPRKESLDSVDFELIKLGLHKSTEDIRAQYLQVPISQSKDNHDDAKEDNGGVSSTYQGNLQLNKQFLLTTYSNPCQKLNIENPRGSSPVPPTPSLLPGCHPAPTTIPETTSSTTGTTPAVTTAAHHFRWTIS